MLRLLILLAAMPLSSCLREDGCTFNPDTVTIQGNLYYTWGSAFGPEEGGYIINLKNSETNDVISNIKSVVDNTFFIHTPLDEKAKLELSAHKDISLNSTSFHGIFRGRKGGRIGDCDPASLLHDSLSDPSDSEDTKLGDIRMFKLEEVIRVDEAK